MVKEYSEKILSDMETKDLGRLYIDVFQHMQEIKYLQSAKLPEKQEEELEAESKLEMITTELKLRDFNERKDIMRIIQGILRNVKSRNDARDYNPKQEYIAAAMLHHFGSNILD